MAQPKLTDGWTVYFDGEEPPPTGAVVLVRFRDGLESKARRAGTLRWTWDNINADIVAYRVLSWGDD